MKNATASSSGQSIDDEGQQMLIGQVILMPQNLVY